MQIIYGHMFAEKQGKKQETTCSVLQAPEIENNRNENPSQLCCVLNHLPLADSFETPAMIGSTDIGV